jgi:hypothetical protein
VDGTTSVHKNLMLESTPFGNTEPEIKVATPKLDDAIEYFEHHPNSQFERLSEALIEIRELINKPKP